MQYKLWFLISALLLIFACTPAEIQREEILTNAGVDPRYFYIKYDAYLDEWDLTFDDVNNCDYDEECVRIPTCCPICSDISEIDYVNEEYFVDYLDCEGFACSECSEPNTIGICVEGKCKAVENE